MSDGYESNPVIDKLPTHLRQFIKPQDYEYYTTVDQAVWRYVMRRNVDYLSKVADASYVGGLQKTGISVDHIPSMYGMNRILKEIGWAAVAVDGFIPPAAFMEFQAFNVLVIASDIRQLGNIEYTPAPDIIHEGAGHAPIIANPEYAEYLRRFGQIGCKAISSSHDYEMYEAIRRLSILKEARSETDPKEIAAAEALVDELQAKEVDASEMARIRNLHWWTVEYGLIGTVDDPKIYGAGLLSSIGESAWCMRDDVKKLPYSIRAADVAFDITKPQPQLFVTPDFAYLSQVLEDFANTMAVRAGGKRAVQRLIDSRALGTVELSTGLQISGIFDSVIVEGGKPVYLQTRGPTALAYREKELIGHGTDIHADGYGTPVGKLEGINLAIEDMSPRDLEAYGVREGSRVTLRFEGGIVVEGDVITGTRNLHGKILLVSFANCLVTHGETVLFKPEWGVFDMAVGQKVISAFSGPADYNSYDMVSHVPSPTPPRAEPSQEQVELERLYGVIRDVREGRADSSEIVSTLASLKQDHGSDWLLALEVYELAKTECSDEVAQDARDHVEAVGKKRADVAHLIEAGLKLLDEETVSA